MSSANALKIEINKGDFRPDPLATVPFYGEDGQDSDLGIAISEIINNDLVLSGLFIPIDSSMFLETKETLCKFGPNIKNWNVLNARFLVYGKITKNSDSFSVTFNLVDVVTGQKMLSLKIDGTIAKMRKVAHIIADYIYERITNEKGYFNTNIVYVETSYNKVSSKRRTRLVKIDQDGFNPRNLTDGSELVLTPRYANDGKMMAFISYRDKAVDALGKSAHIYILDSATGQKRLMISDSLMKELLKKNHGNPVQMTYAPRFSPDNESAVLAIIIDGKSSIYKINFATNKLTQLTTSEGVDWHSRDGSTIDTSPCYSPDGDKIVFTSNRAGREALYTMNADGSDLKKISNSDGRANYSQPVWSPRGDLIAFAKQMGKEFYIGVMKPDGSGERLITSGFLVESPCWSSNGRYLTYTIEPNRGAKPAIAVVDTTGVHARILPTKGVDAADPAWSPTIGFTEIGKQRPEEKAKEQPVYKEAEADTDDEEDEPKKPAKKENHKKPHVKSEGFLKVPEDSAHSHIKNKKKKVFGKSVK